MSRVFLAAAAVVVVVFFAPIRLFLLITANFPCGPALGAHIDINCVLLVQFLLVAQLQREREEGTGRGNGAGAAASLTNVGQLICLNSIIALIFYRIKAHRLAQAQAPPWVPVRAGSHQRRMHGTVGGPQRAAVTHKTRPDCGTQRSPGHSRPGQARPDQAGRVAV